MDRCLQSVESVADDILVVDSFSTDLTEEICKKYNVRFVRNKFEGHIQQKNFALSLSKHPHVLSLDADEALDEEAIAAIQKIKLQDSFSGFLIKRKNFYCGKWIKNSGWYPDAKVRLWNKNLAVWGGTNPHDKVRFFNPPSKLETINGNILHYTYNSKEELIKQSNYFSSIAVHQRKEKGKPPSVLQAIIHCGFKFIKMYFFKFGFLDGRAGWDIAYINAKGTYAKYNYH